MSQPNPVLLTGSYIACHNCKDGRWINPEIDEEKDPKIKDYHLRHQAHDLDIMPASRFLSIYIADGYIDIDREGLEPFNIANGPGEVKDEDTPVGAPKGAAGALAIQRKMRREHLRPLIKPPIEEKSATNSELFHDFFEKWFNKFNVDVPFHHVGFKTISTLGDHSFPSTYTEFLSEKGRYVVSYIIEDLEKLTLGQIEHVACHEVIRIAMMQRAGNDLNLGIEWLTDNLANLIIEKDQDSKFS